MTHAEPFTSGMTEAVIFRSSPVEVIDAFLAAANRPLETETQRKGFLKKSKSPSEFRFSFRPGQYGWEFDEGLWGEAAWIYRLVTGETVLLTSPWEDVPRSGGWDLTQTAESWRVLEVTMDTLGGTRFRQDMWTGERLADELGTLLSDATLLTPSDIGILRAGGNMSTKEVEGPLGSSAQRTLAEIRSMVGETLGKYFESGVTQRDDYFMVVYGSSGVLVETLVHEFFEGRLSTLVKVGTRVATAVPETAEFFRWLALKNGEFVFGKLYAEVEDDKTISVFFQQNLLADWLDEEELQLAVLTTAMTADELDDQIVSVFGGKRLSDA